MKTLSLIKILIITTAIIVLYFLTSLEFDGFKAKTVIYPVLWIVIGVLGFKYFKTLRGTDAAIRKSLLGLGLAVYILGTLFLGLGFLLCAESDHGVIFTNKKDKSLSLVCRTYDCYLTADRCKIYQVRTLTEHIKWVTRFSENRVDTSEWQH